MKIALMLLAAGTLALSAHAVTDVMSFEDLVVNPAADFVAVPNGYHGLDWHGVRVFDPALWNGGFYQDLYDQGIASGSVLATNSPVMTISSAVPFDFVGAFLSSAEDRPVTVEVLASLKGSALYVQSYQVSHLNGQFYNFNFLGVDMLTFVSSDGVPTRFSMDHFTINTPVPEPAPYAMMLVGLAGLGWARAQRSKPATRNSFSSKEPRSG